MKKLHHNEITKLLEDVGFEYQSPHYMKRGSKEHVTFCGSCRFFKHFKNDKLVKELKGEKFSFVQNYVKKVLNG